TDVSGTAWGTPILADSGASSGTSGLHTSQAIVSGYPAIVYYDSVNADLLYKRATNAAGTAWGTPITLDSTGSVGDYPSLQIVQGNPAVSYRDITNGDLKYLRATNAEGTAWSSPVVIDSAGNVGSFTCLRVVVGQPAVSYYDSTNADLKYVRASNGTGSAWGTPVTVATTGNVGQYTSMQIVAGWPAIACYDVSNIQLLYVAANDSTGSIWGTPVVADRLNASIYNGVPGIWQLLESGSQQRLNAIWTSDGNQFWTVGNSGTIRRGAGPSSSISWTPQVSGTTAHLRAIWGTGNSDVWVVGDGGTILRWNGVSWSTQASGTIADLRSIWGTNSSNVYVVASNSLRRWNGSSWLTETLPSLPGSWRAIHGVDATHIWAVGDAPSIVFWNGSTWQSQTFFSPGAFTCVWAADASNVWVLGSSGGGVYWNGSTWTSKSVSATGTPTFIWGRNATSIHAVTDRGEYVSNNGGSGGGNWFATSMQNLPLTGITGNTGNVLMVGDRTSTGENPSLQVVGGRPAVSCRALVVGNYTLRYLRSADANGTAWEAAVTLDTQSSHLATFDSSLQIIAGRPAISYERRGILRFVRATDLVGATWGSSLAIDSIGRVGSYNSMVSLPTGAGISYHDITKGNLKYAVLTFEPEIAIEQPTLTVIPNGGSRDFGPVNVGSATSLTFTVRNSGIDELILTGNPRVSLSGLDATAFAVTSQPATIIGPGSATSTFTIQFSPVSAGLMNATLLIENTDADESSTSIGISGRGTITQQSWRQIWFGTTSNSGDAADTYDFDKDGLVNLIEYAFGLNPTNSSSNQLPVGDKTAYNFTVSFAQPPSVTGITYGAEWSPDLSSGSWLSVSDTGTGLNHVFSIPVGVHEHLFIRLVVTVTP
ncbi:MAG: choice-of-anchor D domain-containing protein, partial [Prosthecobacter sp.]